MTRAEVDETTAPLSKEITGEAGTKVVQELTQALKTDGRPSRPEFPAIWQSQPNVMFDAGDPNPEPFPWGKPTWTEQTYDETLAKFLGDLACSRNAPEAQIRGIAYRALYFLVPWVDSDRLWRKLFAARVLGPDCPPAKGLREETHRQLEQLAAQSALSKTPEATAPGLN
jgi:hypothetical protein